MSVNVSARQLREKDLYKVVTAALESSGLDPCGLELELTESALMEDLDIGVASLGELSDLGVRTALDDFGAGYSSLSYLSRFRLQTLKISEEFIQGVCEDPKVASIAGIMIELAHSLGLRVVAEGVERDDQRRFLADRGCEAYQGYLRAKPQPAEEMEKWMLQRIASGASRAASAGQPLRDSRIGSIVT